MNQNINDLTNFLKQLSVFHSIKEDYEFSELANKFTIIPVHEDQAIYVKGDAPSGIYFINKGALQALDYDKKTGDLIIQENLYRGDYAGEVSAIRNKPHSITLYAVQETQLLHLSNEDFQWLITTYPETKPYFENSARTRRETRRKTFAWLTDEERIYQICRRHPIRMIRAISQSLAALLFSSGFLITALYIIKNPIINKLAWGIEILVFLAAFVYLLWHLFDWRYDMYYITNQRVQRQEHTWFFIEKMHNIPLHTINAIDVKTDSIITRRIFDFGTIRAHTKMGEIELTDLPNPNQTKNMIQELANRNQIIQNDVSKNDMHQIMGDILSGHHEENKKEPVSPIDSFDIDIPHIHNIFKTRTVTENGTITYHKHWIILIQKISVPILVLFAMATFAIIGYQEIMSNLPMQYILFFALLGVGSLIGSLLWTGYQVADWQNDIYQLSGYRIFDLEKKPLGKEERNTAQIKDIISVRSDKPTIWAKIFNYGDLIIEFGKKDFTFFNIHDPLQAHSDVSERISQFEKSKRTYTAEEEKRRMATWINAYHEAQQEFTQLTDEEEKF